MSNADLLVMNQNTFFAMSFEVKLENLSDLFKSSVAQERILAAGQE